MNVKNILFTHVQVYAESDTFQEGFLKVKDGKIFETGLMKELKEQEGYEEVILPNHAKIIPGLIDMHIHGVDGVDTMDATKEALDKMSSALTREGTTSFLATTITQEKNAIEKALANAGEYILCSQSPGKAEVLGIHLEGPFINQAMAGAQPKNHIINPDIGLFTKWQAVAQNQIKVVTLAPETKGGMEFVRYLNETGTVASIGHSNATYHEATAAIRAGASQVTHLFNQMRGMHHREPGVVGAALLHDHVFAELIADGIHVRPEIVEVAFKQKGHEGVILITDSMRAKCLTNGTYDLGGQAVKVKEGKAVLDDGTLAGSILKLGQAVKNMRTYTGCSLRDAIQMASVNPAKQLQVFDRKGSIAIGKDADLVILDKHDELFLTVCKGEIAYVREGEWNL